MKPVIIIPARYESTRLPGKPLIDLCGTPMVVRTYQQCIKAVDSSMVYVATDDDRVRSVCETRDIKVLMTSSNCLTGTDRVAESAKQIPADVYINIQGDEPVFNPEDIRALQQAIAKYPGEIINGYCSITSESQFKSTQVPKVVFRDDGKLLYMSRASIPTDKKNAFQKAWRQVCAYAFPKEALKAFTSVKQKTKLEQIEDIEILRFLELGWDVRMISMTDHSAAVDNPEDVKIVENLIRKRNL